jgi:hypothetical protein
MNQFTIRKAERTKSKLRLAIAGPSGSGKTMGALKTAKGMGGKTCLIDTERGSGDLYANLFEYDVITLSPPFKPEILIQALNAAEQAGYDNVIVDSLSHFWSDEGGLLDQADKLEASGKNRFTLWAEITPQHRRLVNAILNSPKHVIATMRSKQSYAMEKDEKTGKNTVKKMGLAPVQREGMEYEFTVFFDVESNHYTRATKDRTNMFADEVFQLNEATGARLTSWLNEGVNPVRQLKKDILAQMKIRLEIPFPGKEDMSIFMVSSISNLVELEWSEDNLQEILDSLIQISDKAWAQKVAWNPRKMLVPKMPQDTEEPPEEVVEDPKPEIKAPVAKKAAKNDGFSEASKAYAKKKPERESEPEVESEEISEDDI